MSRLIQNEILDDITYVYNTDDMRWDSDPWAAAAKAQAPEANIINPKEEPHSYSHITGFLEIHKRMMESLKVRAAERVINPPVICNTKGVAECLITELITSGRAPWYYLAADQQWHSEEVSKNPITQKINPTLEEYQAECEKECMDTRVELPLPELPQAAYDYLCSTAMPHGKKLIFDR